MDDFLTPVKTTRNIKDKIEKFESLHANNFFSTPTSKTKKPITTVRDDHTSPSTKKSPVSVGDVKIHVSHAAQNGKRDSAAFLQQIYLNQDQLPHVAGSSLADDARQILKSQPNQEDLASVLTYLQYGIDGKHDFNVKVTDAKTAQIIGVLASTILPDMWPNFTQEVLSTEESQMKKTILSCLSCTAGIGALVAEIRHQVGIVSAHTFASRLGYLMSALSDVLRRSTTITNLLMDTQKLYNNEMQRRITWQEIVSLVAGGRILSTTAQAIAVISKTEADFTQSAWLGDGKEYSQWLAKNVVAASTKLQPSEKDMWDRLGQLVQRALNLGHKEIFVNQVYSSLLFGPKAFWTPLHQIMKVLSDYDQKLIFDTILLDLSNKCFGGTSGFGFANDASAVRAISAAAALVSGLIQANETLQEYLEEWLVIANASYATIGLASRRALIAVLATSEDKLEHILTRCLSNFSDKLQIQHASSLQQDANAQTILLAIGYLQRAGSKVLTRPHISSLLMQSVSNRLDASVPRSRFLGMIVGTAYSKAVDSPGKALDFGVEEMESEEAKTWLKLLDVKDTVADGISPQDLFALDPTSFTGSVPLRKPHIKQTTKRSRPEKEIISIEEVSDSESEDEGLVPYAKPDSDPEDSDDDPTLINRSKLSAPVYISALIQQLQADDKPDAIELALKSAPGLIRRKIGFGTELSDNLHTLTSVLVNLQEGMNETHLQTLRLQSLIACVVAKPDLIAPSLAALYFDGDFSIFQRVVILSAIGLSARELAGFEQDDTNMPQTTDETFPSKRLPAQLQPSISSPQLEAYSQNPISPLTLAEAQSTIRPMALAAADKMTGPSVLKIRTFSSRMEVEKKREKKAQARTKIIPKNLHSLLVNSFYLPLCCRMSLLLSSTISFRSTGSPNTTILLPSLTRMLLQTLTLVLHTLGPSASLHLPVITQETLLLLISLHATSGLSTNPMVLPALLHLLLALMDITIEAGYTAQERLISDNGSQVSELVTWSNELGDRISIPDVHEQDDGGMPWSILAAGIQVKWYEMGQRFQGRMLGLGITSD